MKVNSICGYDWWLTTWLMSGSFPTTSPPHDKTINLKPLADSDILYLNLHGYEGKAHYKGQRQSKGEWPVILTPENVSAVKWQNTVVYAEVCYGAADRPENREMAKAFLQNGCSAFVGSLTDAYGSVIPTFLLDGKADRLGKFFVYGIKKYKDPHKALKFAKKYLRLISYPLDKRDKETLESFVVLETKNI